MTEQMLLRFAMILQSQAPSTLNKYICKLAEAVLLEYHEGLRLYELNQAINSQFSLAFTEEEIEAAIAKKGQGRILVSNGTYSLSISGGIFLIFTALNKLISFLGSEDREDDLYERFYKQNKSTIS